MKTTIFNSIESLEPVKNLLIDRLNITEMNKVISVESMESNFDPGAEASLTIQMHSEVVTVIVTVDSEGYNLDFSEVDIEWNSGDLTKYNKIHLFLIDFFTSLEELVNSDYFKRKF